MEKATLEITSNGEYKNIELKEKFERKNGNIVIEDGVAKVKHAGMPNDTFIIVEKTFAECKEIETKFGKSYLAGAEYEGEKVSFWLNQYEAPLFNACGGVGDKVRIRMEKGEKINPKTGMKYMQQKLSFDLEE